MKLFRSVLVLGLMLVAPLAHPADNYLVADQPPAPHKITFVDERTAKDLKGGLPFLSNPTYSVPDKRITPTLLDLLGAALEARLGKRLAGKEVKIARLQLQNYFAATYHRHQAVGLAITAATTNIYLAVDNGDDVDAVIFRAHGSIDALEFDVKYALPYKARGYSGMVYNAVESRAKTKEVVTAGIDKTAEQIELALNTLDSQ